MKDVRPILAYATPPKRSRLNPREVAGVVVYFMTFFSMMISSGLYIGHHVDRLSSLQVIMVMLVSFVLASGVAFGMNRLFAKLLFSPRR